MAKLIKLQYDTILKLKQSQYKNKTLTTLNSQCVFSKRDFALGMEYLETITVKYFSVSRKKHQDKILDFCLI